MVHATGAVDHSAPLLPSPLPGAPASCQGRHRASTVFRWFRCDGGDPAKLVADFLAGNGLAVRNFGRTVTEEHPTGAGTVCGAALYVSAAAGSVMAGGPAGAPSPVPAIPDVYAVVYVHSAGSVPSAPAGPWELGRWTPSW